jgi:hypothetical protein
MSKNKSEERYSLTVLGMLEHRLGKTKGREVYDALELYMRRHNFEIAPVEGKLAFVEMVKQEAKP